MQFGSIKNLIRAQRSWRTTVLENSSDGQVTKQQNHIGTWTSGAQIPRNAMLERYKYSLSATIKAQPLQPLLLPHLFCSICLHNQDTYFFDSPLES